MASDNYTSTHDFRASLVNESWSGYTDAANNGLGAIYLAYLKSLETFPTSITNYIFNIIYAFGIITNVVLLAYLIYYKRYQTPVFCVILSLGVADLGVSVGGLLFYSLITPFIIGPLWLCNIAIPLLHLSYLSSSYHIAMFAVLRYLQLVHPLTSYAKVTTSLLFKICITIWGINSIQAIVIAGYYEPFKIATTASHDMFVCLFMGNMHIRTIWTITVWIVVPFLATIGVHISKQVMVMLSHPASVTSHDEQLQQMRRQTDSRALAIVIMTYLLTMFPFIIQAFRVYVLNITIKPIEVYLVEVFSQIAYTNSAVNPWIYLFAAESVRSNIKRILTCNKSIDDD